MISERPPTKAARCLEIHRILDRSSGFSRHRVLALQQDAPPRVPIDSCARARSVWPVRPWADPRKTPHQLPQAAHRTPAGSHPVYGSPQRFLMPASHPAGKFPARRLRLPASLTGCKNPLDAPRIIKPRSRQNPPASGLCLPKRSKETMEQISCKRRAKSHDSYVPFSQKNGTARPVQARSNRRFALTPALS
jgi:hypothetical protein